jgi:outer membrane protein OmpA-like peptidoglycan-associated protein
MQALSAKRVLIVVMAVFSLSLMVGCTHILGIEKSSAARNGDYYPTCLVKADQALDEARMAGKDKECPEEFNALKDTVDSAYKVHLACNTEGACQMAKEAVAKIKGLCPARPRVETKPEPPLESVPAAEPTPGTAKYCITLNILFDIDKAVIRDEYRDEVGRVATFMQKFPSTTAVIEGHTDDVGTDEHNMLLSQKRAESVVNYLVDNFGIDRSRLSAKGYGKTQPIADNRTEEGRQKNRRTDAITDCAVDIKGLKPVPDKLCLNLKVQFDTDKADIKPAYSDEIAKVADFMKENPTVTALIEGHTDNVGSAAYNMKLSQERAESVVNYLVEKFGIERYRLSAKGYGETRRIAYNTTPEGRAKNRRVNAILDCVIKK